MNHNKHSYLMIGLLGIGAVLFLSGTAGGGFLFLLWPVACMAMMFVMMRGMGSGMQGPREHTHDDGVSHTHEDLPTRSQQ